ncbi:DNA excision repair protein ERCC-8-like [Dorcoceras hygrometricum]|uniref:DNA excision repair protein ERCC-8-like n=1 Tax=Dorcoceras hygrometricum TaxID=472368 RepID=A0A2Z7CDI9_9LAMI|nr:DNA excision repair protein ERCC-8-like [Dorcoceras hygrometricum]
MYGGIDDQVDLTEGRYLLAGAADATVAVYDVQRATSYEGGGLIAKHKSVVVINKQPENGHRYAISSAVWYPMDTGLFITGSYDHHVNVWDTNTTQVVQNFKMPGKVYKIAMSSQARSHMLIATGTEDVQVRLCDIASGTEDVQIAHHLTLVENSYLTSADDTSMNTKKDGVMSLEWSTSSEWVLVTGGCDGAIRFWDIRRAGCFHILDQSHSQLGRRPPLLSRIAINKNVSESSDTCPVLLPRACDGQLGSRGVPARGVPARADDHLESRGVSAIGVPARRDGHFWAKGVLTSEVHRIPM